LVFVEAKVFLVVSWMDNKFRVNMG